MSATIIDADIRRASGINGDAYPRRETLRFAHGQLWERIAERKIKVSKIPGFPHPVSARIILDRFDFALSECDGDEIRARGPILADVTPVPGWRPFGGWIWKGERCK